MGDLERSALSEVGEQRKDWNSIRDLSSSRDTHPPRGRVSCGRPVGSRVLCAPVRTGSSQHPVLWFPLAAPFPWLLMADPPEGQLGGAPLSTAVLSSLLPPGTGPCHSVALVNSDADFSDTLLQVQIS